VALAAPPRSYACAILRVKPPGLPYSDAFLTSAIKLGWAGLCCKAMRKSWGRHRRLVVAALPKAFSHAFARLLAAYATPLRGYGLASVSNLATQLEVSKEGIWRTVTGLHNKGGGRGEGRVDSSPLPTLFIKGVLENFES